MGALEPGDSAGFSQAFSAFAIFARRLIEGRSALRQAKAPPASLFRVAALALQADRAEARAFFERNFERRRIAASGFVTGYYEPEVLGSLTASGEFSAPILARPADLISFAPGEGPKDLDPTLAGARRRADGMLEPYPDRAEIETEARNPIVWLADAVEVFMIQVQGSARVRLPDGRKVRLVYDGRNGKPYTSIGRSLIEAGEIGADAMSLARLEFWLRVHGVMPGQRGREEMWRNRSYVFFRLEEDSCPSRGPIGGAGAPLTPLTSLAVDRKLWCYGLPFWIEAELPWRNETPEPYRRLMIAEDTGAAIVGPGRFDIFFGTGDAAGARAGAIRHRADATALWPRESVR